MMKKEQFLKLLSRKLSGEISSSEFEALGKAIEGNEEYKQTADKLGHYFLPHKDTNVKKTAQLKKTWAIIERADVNNLHSEFDYSAPKSTKSIFTPFLKIAVVLVLLIGAGIAGYNLLRPVTDQGFDKMATRDQQTFRLLNDGTKIWLNKNSSISYNKAFGQHKREIFLEGEAYFDVAKNKAVPLFIHAGNIDIEVKGTAFNVNAYKANREIQVALIRGSIQVTNRLDRNNKVLLKPNEKLSFANTSLEGHSNGFIVVPMDLKLSLAATRWTSDTLIFRKERLKDLAPRLEKKYNFKIEIQSAKLEEKRFSGIFTNETIQQAMEALKFSYPLTYMINDRLIIIKEQR